MAVMKHCSVQMLNNMKLETGKLYQIKFERAICMKEPPNYGDIKYIKENSVVLMLDYNPANTSTLDFNRFKVLTEDGTIGWIMTGMKAETLFESIA